MAGPAVYKVRCPACGKGLWVDQMATGEPVVCRACGHRFEVPFIPLLGPMSEEDDTTGPNPLTLAPHAAADQEALSPSESDSQTVSSPLAALRPVASAEEAASAPGSADGLRRDESASADTAALNITGLSEPEPANVQPIVSGSADDFQQPYDVVPIERGASPPLLLREGLAEGGWPEPVMIQSPIGQSAPAAPIPLAPVEPPVLRVARTEGPDPEDQIVPMMLDRSGSEPGWVSPPFAGANFNRVPLPPAVEKTPAFSPPASNLPMQPSSLHFTAQQLPAMFGSPAAPSSPLSSSPTNVVHLEVANPSARYEPASIASSKTLPEADLSGIEQVGGRLEPAGLPFVPAGATVNASVAPRVGTRGDSKAGWWALAGLLLAAAAVVGWLFFTDHLTFLQSWEAGATVEAATLKRQADGYVATGSLKDAERSYRKIEQLVRGHELHDPVLRQTAEQASREVRRLSGLLARRDAAPVDGQASAGTGSPGSAPTAGAIGPPPATGDSSATVPSAATLPAPAGVASAGGSIPQPGTVTPDDPAAPRPPPLSGRQTVPGDSGTVAPPSSRTNGRPIPRPSPLHKNGVTDEEIGLAIQRGVDYLVKQIEPKTHLLRDADAGDHSFTAGMNALAIYALLQAGQAVEDPRLQHTGPDMRAMTRALTLMPMDGSHQTYARALRSTCLALFNQPDDFKTMAEDADWLLGTTDGGSYSYNGPYKKPLFRGGFPSANGGGDNSNSQYGLLGVWSAADADSRVEVPLAYWRAVAKHWTDSQESDGQWAYTKGSGPRLSMTSAGIASLFVAHEYLEPATIAAAAVGREPFPPALKKGLDWFEQRDHAVSVRDGSWWGYQLYGIERVGLASGFKQFGTHDWYRELAATVLERQHGNGSWGDETVDTAYALLFLSRGRHPVLMNKLRFNGYWANRPRDVANLARFATRQLERPINWQVVNVANPWTNWTDSPILFIASHLAVPLGDEQMEKLRRFVEAGGMLVTHADAGAPAFDAWAKELASKLFPAYELLPIPDNHALWSSAYKVTSRPPAMGVSNGARLLMVHFPQDISTKWQKRDDKAGKPLLELGVNLFLYAAGKRDLRNRLDSAWVEASTAEPIDTVRIARLRYEGNWDPEPGAWTRYGNWFQRQTSVRLSAEPIKLSSLSADAARTMPVAHLTGTDHVRFAEADINAFRAYVEAGGLVIIDSTGGMNGFDVDVRESLLPRAFPNRLPLLVDPGHPLLSETRAGMVDLSKTRVRPFTFERFGVGVGTVQLLTPEKGTVPNRPPGGVLITSLDLTSGLLGISTWGIIGFDPKYSQLLMKNAIFWAQDGMPAK